jgi:aryl-alcohol dehydrogenase-like predicted oxidoreductase
VDSPIIGATKMKHLEEAVDAVEIVLSDEDIAYLEEPYTPKAILGHR